MNATKFLAAAAVFVAAGSAFAAETPATSAAVTTVASTANTSIAAVSLNVPSVTVTNVLGRTRGDVQAEAVQEVKTYRTTLAKQLDILN
jgi:hypothetical protein